VIASKWLEMAQKKAQPKVMAGDSFLSALNKLENIKVAPQTKAPEKYVAPELKEPEIRKANNPNREIPQGLLKTAQKSIAPTKIMAGDNFRSAMSNLGNIQQSQALKERGAKREEDYEKEYSEGIRYLREFTHSNNSEYLKKAANKFFDAMKCKKSRPEPYCYLSYIFYVYNQRGIAIEYLEIARALDPNRPELRKIQNAIYSNQYR
jgi:hypothetical protein